MWPCPSRSSRPPATRTPRQRPRWCVALAVTVLAAIPLTAGTAAAQAAVEIGGQVGAANAVSDKPSDGFATGAFGGVWFDDRFGLRGRYLRSAFDARRRPVADGVQVTGDRTRALLTAEFVYAFRRGDRVRPLLGVAVGTRHDHSRRSCEPVSCDVLQAGTFEQVTSGTLDVNRATRGLLGGVAVAPMAWLKLEALFSLHDWPGERIITAFTVGVAIVPWRSR